MMFPLSINEKIDKDKVLIMDIIYLLIPVSLILIVFITLAFMWAIKSGQFDDLEGPAHEILMDDDKPIKTTEKP